MNADTLSQAQVIEFLYRSYVAADGLWFMKAEERFGFDIALDMDREVWSVVPKIQARLLKSMLKGDNDAESLLRCVQAKMRIEGFAFEAEPDRDGFSLHISRCPWHDLRVKAKREHLSAAIGDAICTTEYSVFTSEFGKDIAFSKGQGICRGATRCIFRFRRASPDGND